MPHLTNTQLTAITALAVCTGTLYGILGHLATDNLPEAIARGLTAAGSTAVALYAFLRETSLSRHG